MVEWKNICLPGETSGRSVFGRFKKNGGKLKNGYR
jgi:hypothetical protein